MIRYRNANRKRGKAVVNENVNPAETVAAMLQREKK